MVHINTEWEELREVVLGSAERMCAPRPGESFPANSAPPATWLFERLAWHVFGRRPLPKLLTSRFAKELSGVAQVLARHDVWVHRPAPVYELPGEPPGVGEVFPRDPVVAVDNTFVLCRHRIPLLRKEIRGLTHIVDGLRRQGTRVVGPPPEGVFLEGGDVLVDLPNVYVGVGSIATNAAGAAWLQDVLGPKAKVIPITIIDPKVFHLDVCLSLTSNSTGIVYRPALQSALPASLAKYELVEIDRRTFQQIGANVLRVGKHSVLVQRRHRSTLGHCLERQGFEVIALPFSWHATCGGGFRCATNALVREESSGRE